MAAFFQLKRLILEDDVYKGKDDGDLSFLCEHMAWVLNYTCPKHPSPLDCPDFNIIYRPTVREFGIPVRNQPNSSASSYYFIKNCPWCGNALPKALHDEYDQELAKVLNIPVEDINLETYSSADIPSEFKTDAWWKKRGL